MKQRAAALIYAAAIAANSWDSARQSEETCVIDKKVFEGRWQQIRAKSVEWWDLINDIDLDRLDKSPDKFKKYVMLLQVKYGYSSKFAGEEINRHVEECEPEENAVQPMEAAQASAPARRRKARKS
jgi:hypothetical protein